MSTRLYGKDGKVTEKGEEIFAEVGRMLEEIIKKFPDIHRTDLELLILQEVMYKMAEMRIFKVIEERKKKRKEVDG